MATRRLLLMVVALSLAAMTASEAATSAPIPRFSPELGPNSLRLASLDGGALLEADRRDQTDAAGQALLDRLQDGTGGRLRISYHPLTGRVDYLGTEMGYPMPQPIAVSAGVEPEEAARAYLSVYGPLFGLTDEAYELSVTRVRSADRGRSFVRFQQVHQGLAVLGGELIVQMDKQRDVLSVTGEVLPSPAVSTVPAIAAGTAQRLALAVAAKTHELSPELLTATEPELWIYNPLLLGAPGPQRTELVWRVEVNPVQLLPISELVLVDAHLGAVPLHFNQVSTGMYRSVYDNRNSRSEGLPGRGPVRTEGQGPSGIEDVDTAYEYAGDVYAFYRSFHGRDSIDGAGMELISTVRYCPEDTEEDCPYPNAYWTSRYGQMVYGEGYASADDVVGHEMTHGVTDYESNLYYYRQSGAISESFSDVWGEFADQINGKGNDSAAVRWLIGEDLPGGASRNMANPTNPPTPCPPGGGQNCRPRQPDKVSSPYYRCDEGDQGGVHRNSGVANKAAYLMVQGGSFNGRNVNGLGMDKVAKIWYEAQTNLLTSAADFENLYHALWQACTNLIGTSGITVADCQQVRNAVDATEMNQQPGGCPAPEAPVCPDGQLPVDLFFDDLENPASGNWSSEALVGLDFWFYPQLVSPDLGLDFTYATSGRYNFFGFDYDDVADFYIGMTSDVELPPGSAPYLHFKHSHKFEFDDNGNYDGGVVEYSTSSGASWSDAGALFTHNGYGGRLHSGYGNPLAGRQAFVASSNGYVSSRLRLQSLSGRSVRFRFRIGTDRSAAALGWFVDDVRIYTCQPETPTPTASPTQTSTATRTSSPTPTETRPGAVWRTYVPVLLKGFLPAPPPVTATPTASPTLPSGECVTILNEDFEGPFPGPWDVGDLQPGDGEYYWSRSDCRPYEGLYSGWAVGGGADGAGLPCGSDYPNNVDSEMTYGPFSLADAGAADLSLRVWLNAQWGHEDERVFWGATDGQSIVFASRFGVTDGWIEQTLDLNALVGRPQVWVTIGFTTDSSGTRPEGAYVDNIVLRKCPSAPVPPTKTPTATPTATRPGEPTPTATRTATRTRVPTATPTQPASGWATIKSEDFEGLFPGEWLLVDNMPGYGEYGWGKRECRPYGGAYSGWAVGAGAQGSQLSCGSNYPDHAESWMIYGPFSLVGTTAAELAFKVWLNSELDHDYISYMASIDGQNFYGWYQGGRDQQWKDAIFDLRDVYVLGDVTGQPEVWVALVFESDDSRHFREGCYVDDIVLRKCTSGECAGAGGVNAPQAGVSGVGRIKQLPGALLPAAQVMPHPSREAGDVP